MMHRHSRRSLALQGRRFRWREAPGQPAEERRDSALIERPSREEVLEIVRQQRLHFLLLERAMEQLSSEVPDDGEIERAPVPSLPSADPRVSLQHDLEAILLAELCDESELDSSTEIDPPGSAPGRSAR